MKIAVLGWGSLVWNPKRESVALNISDDKWFLDGPELPVEFARISKNKRLTLVLFPAREKVTVLWAIMASNNLDEAIYNLREVEEIPASSQDKIGYVNLRSGRQRSSVVSDIADEIRQWGYMKKVEAVVWTDLPSNFEKETGTVFTDDNVISYLENLPNHSKKNAEEYVRRAPRQIRTGLRSYIERELGWFPA